MRFLLVLTLCLVVTGNSLAFDVVTKPVTLYAGDDWNLSVELANSAKGQPFDLGGSTCQARVKKTWYDTTVLADLGCQISGTKISVAIDKSKTSTLRGLNGVWDLALTNSSGKSLTLWRSPFIINLTTR